MGYVRSSIQFGSSTATQADPYNDIQCEIQLAAISLAYI